MSKEKDQLKKRSAVNVDDKWDVEKIFLSLEAGARRLDEMRQLAGDKGQWPDFSELKGKLNVKENLKKFLDQYYAVERRLVKIYTYAHLKFDEDIASRDAKELFEMASLMINQFKTATSWANSEILKLDEALFNAITQDVLFVDYKNLLRQLKNIKPFILSEKEELILSLSKDATRSISKTFGALDNADLEFEPCKNEKGESLPLSHGRYGSYMQNKDRTLRKSAFENMHGAYKQHENTFSELLTGQVKTHHLEAKARGYESCVHAALNENEVDVAVYMHLIASVKKRLPSLHAYTAHRKKALGLDEMFAYDLQVPLTQIADQSYSYERARDMVLSSLQDLGSDYIEIATKGLKEQRWVDKYENKNKRSGAYSSGCFDSNPYVLMNFNGSLRDVFTLAHELGHSMHSYFSNKNRLYVDSSYSIFVAEVASTFNEKMLLKYLIEQASTEQEKKRLIYFALDNIRATLFRQTLFAEFELTIHTFVEQSRPLSAPLFKEIYLKLHQEYYGPSLATDESLSVECFRIPHFYYNFYVYQYATGISAALTLHDKVSKGERGAKEKYLEFLCSGSTRDPVTLLDNAGVCMRDGRAIDTTIDHFDYLLKQIS